MDVALEAIKHVGAYNAITAFCVVVVSVMLCRDWRRTDRIEKDLKDEQEYRREVIVPLLNDCKDALNHNTQVIAQATDALNRNTQVIERLLLEKL